MKFRMCAWNTLSNMCTPFRRLSVITCKIKNGRAHKTFEVPLMYNFSKIFSSKLVQNFLKTSRTVLEIFVYVSLVISLNASKYLQDNCNISAKLSRISPSFSEHFFSILRNVYEISIIFLQKSFRSPP